MQKQKSRAAISVRLDERSGDCSVTQDGRVIVRNIRIAIMAACVPIVIGVLAGPANAGDYYDSGYRREWRSPGVSYSTDCCYRKIIRHWRSVRYERVYEPPRRRYYPRRYGETYYGPNYRYSDDYYPPRRYVDETHYAPRRSVSETYYEPRRSVSESYYRPRRYADYRSFSDDCQLRRLWDGQGGWVWAIRRGCR
jgi:hypothetical protein